MSNFKIQGVTVPLLQTPTDLYGGSCNGEIKTYSISVPSADSFQPRSRLSSKADLHNNIFNWSRCECNFNVSGLYLQRSRAYVYAKRCVCNNALVNCELIMNVVDNPGTCCLP